MGASFSRLVGSGFGAGLLAGSLVGFCEAAAILAAANERPDLQVLWYGPLLYGLLMAMAGGGLGAASALLGRFRPSSEGLVAFAFPAVLFGSGFIFGRFRIVRDLLGEHPLSALQQLGLLALFGIAFLASWLALRTLAREGRVHPLLRARAHVLVAAVLVLTGLVISAVAGPREEAPPAVVSGIPGALANRPNVILIMVDTLRADRLSIYGYGANATPAIDALARDGIVFDDAFAAASWTKPSTATLISGTYPSSHTAVGKADLLPEAVTTVAEVLQGAGWETGGIVTNVNLSPGYQFDQGYDEYLYLPPDYFFGARESSSKLAGYSILRLLRERFIVRHKKVAHYYQDGQAVTEIAREWLDRHAERRFFLFLHYMDPHDPYFRHPYDGEAVARVHTPRPAPDRAKELSDLYDGEIRYLDRHLGELVSFLKERGLYDETLIVLTSDHGEEFHEHGGWWHGTTLYDEQIRVPLILKHAGNGPAGHSPGSRIAGVARLLDVAPTILDLAGLEAPPAMQGVSLARSTPGKESFSEEDFEGNRLRSLRGATWKLIEANSGNPRGLPEQALFDLAVDPGEAQNLAERESMRAKAMQGRMDHTMGAALKAAVTGEKVVIDATTRERLKALGYVE